MVIPKLSKLRHKEAEELAQVNSRSLACWTRCYVLQSHTLLPIRSLPVYQVTPSLAEQKYSLLKVKVLVTQLYPTLTFCNTLDCSSPGSSVCGILQASLLEWIAISFPRKSSWPRDQTQVSCLEGRSFTISTTREEPNLPLKQIVKSQFYPDFKTE